RAVHRQRRDDRLRRPLPRARPLPRLPGDGRVRDGGAAAVSDAADPAGAPGAVAGERADAPTITLYTRPGCHLCDDAREILVRVRNDLPFALDERDIEADDALHGAYLERIPVVALDGEELFEFFVDEDELRRRLGA